MLQAANTDLFNPLFPKADNGECQNLPTYLQVRIGFFRTDFKVRLVNH